MVKILVADSAGEFCSAVADAFYGRYTVLTCNDGRSALKLLCEEKPEVLWLDLMLPGMDGLTVLQSAALHGVRPKLIACIRHDSEYIMRMLERFSVSLVMQKPVDWAAAEAHLDALAAGVIRDQGGSVATADQLTYETLMHLGLTGKRCGCKCLYVALLKKIMDPDCQITKRLYPEVADQCGGSSQSVERAIRCVIGEAWENSGDPHWDLYFPEYQDKCPSNGAFLDRLADKIRSALPTIEENEQPPVSK